MTKNIRDKERRAEFQLLIHRICARLKCANQGALARLLNREPTVITHWVHNCRIPRKPREWLLENPRLNPPNVLPRITEADLNPPR